MEFEKSWLQIIAVETMSNSKLDLLKVFIYEDSKFSILTFESDIKMPSMKVRSRCH